MARKSRKNTDKEQTKEAVRGTDKLYRAALYVRLSVEDERKIESETVENQIRFLRGYLADREDLMEADLYVDRGISGTKFDRPEFNRMMEDMKAGKFNCIVVKDLSRFGRNYLETGNYLESIFPIFGIRFISVTDNYDSLISKPTEDGLIVPLKNLINEAYAKDFSKKISTSKHIMQKQGKYLGCYASYGYKKDPEDHNHFVVDEEVRPIVVRIFEERAAGKSYESIAEGLNADGIPSPGKYRYDKGEATDKRFQDSLWVYGTVRRILLNRNYIGDTVQGKTRQALYKGQAFTRIPEEDQVCVEGTHEAIISRELFDKVHEMVGEKRDRNHRVIMPENYYKDIIFCGGCGHGIKYRSHSWKDRRYFGYTCYAYRIGKGKCSYKYIRKRDLDAIVEKVLDQHIRLYESGVELMRKANAGRKAKTARKKCGARISHMEAELEKIRNKGSKLYEDFADGVISEEDYLFARKTFRDREEELTQAISAMESEAEHYAGDYCGDSEMTGAFEKAHENPVLSSEVVHALISRIDFHTKERIEITFRFQDELEAFIREAEERAGGSK